MVPYRYHIVGINLLILVYTAQSFVLLTANMDDIKKLASKFVSESLADKIAEFILQATEQVNSPTPNVSEENDLNQDVSDDSYTIRNVLREGTAKPDNTKKYNDRYSEYKYKPRTTPSPPPITQTDSDANILEAKLKYWEKQRNEISVEKYSAEEPQKYGKKILQREERQQKLRPDNISKERDSRDFKESKFNKDYIQSKLVKRRPSGPKYKTTEKRGLVKLSALSSSESNHKMPQVDKYENPRDERKPIKEERKTSKSEMLKTETTRFRGLRAIADMTTLKEKTDFDQYDNRNYPKAEFIATSGPVRLPRMPMLDDESDWWDKNIPPYNRNQTEV